MLKCLNVKMLKCEEGVSLCFGIIILFVLLAIVLGLATILLGQTRMIKGMGDSVAAFYAGDTGIERILYEIKQGIYTPVAGETPYSDELLSNGAAYTVKIESLGPPIQIQSVGSYKEVKRAIEINYQ